MAEEDDKLKKEVPNSQIKVSSLLFPWCEIVRTADFQSLIGSSSYRPIDLSSVQRLAWRWHCLLNDLWAVELQG